MVRREFERNGCPLDDERTACVFSFAARRRVLPALRQRAARLGASSLKALGVSIAPSRSRADMV